MVNEGFSTNILNLRAQQDFSPVLSLGSIKGGNGLDIPYLGDLELEVELCGKIHD